MDEELIALLEELGALRAEAKSARAFIRGSETQLTKVMARADAVEARLRQIEFGAKAGAGYTFRTLTLELPDFDSLELAPDGDNLVVTGASTPTP